MGGTGGSKWEAPNASSAAVPCSSPSACEALAFPKGIVCPWVPAGSRATCMVTVSQLDIVVALQGKAAWELQQKQEALYLQFAFKHSTARPLAHPQLPSTHPSPMQVQPGCWRQLLFYRGRGLTDSGKGLKKWKL